MNAKATESDDDEIFLTTVYSEHSEAKGALYYFVYVHENREVDFTRSVFLVSERNVTHNHTSLPYLGEYRVFVYDIESDGTLSSGEGYPADEFFFEQVFNSNDTQLQGIIIGAQGHCKFFLAEVSNLWTCPQAAKMELCG